MAVPVEEGWCEGKNIQEGVGRPKFCPALQVPHSGSALGKHERVIHLQPGGLPNSSLWCFKVSQVALKEVL